MLLGQIQILHRRRRPTSTKTRIETYIYIGGRLLLVLVEDQHPLKQGLKPMLLGQIQILHRRRRPTSTKTRIETYIYIGGRLLLVLVEDQHPLKQGLKHIYSKTP